MVGLSVTSSSFPTPNWSLHHLRARNLGSIGPASLLCAFACDVPPAYCISLPLLSSTLDFFLPLLSFQCPLSHRETTVWPPPSMCGGLCCWQDSDSLTSSSRDMLPCKRFWGRALTPQVLTVFLDPSVKSPLSLLLCRMPLAPGNSLAQSRQPSSALPSLV